LSLIVDKFVVSCQQDFDLHSDIGDVTPQEQGTHVLDTLINMHRKQTNNCFINNSQHS